MGHCYVHFAFVFTLTVHGSTGFKFTEYTIPPAFIANYSSLQLFVGVASVL